MKKIEDYVGHYLGLFDEFFKKNPMYRIEDLAQELDLEVLKARSFLSQYADYHLGIQIRDCIIKEGSCQFKAEL